MKYILAILIVCLGLTTVGLAQQSRAQESAESAELWQIFQQISDMKAAGHDISAEVYERYFQLDQIVHPELYDRGGATPLDQFSNLCPGGLVVGPDSGMTFVYATSGATNTATNNCTFPACRLGRDVFIRLEVQYKDSVTITTCGSGFDTYLCIYTGACCGQTGATLFASNDNAPEYCGGPTSLQAGISRCFDPGVYYIVLDGYGPAAFGQYRFTVNFHGNSCIPPITDPVCPSEFSIHEESFPEGCDAFSNTVHCGEGFCGQIDETGDLDVYALTVTGCERQVTISVFADDTPGRTGYQHGLNSHLRVWPVTCEAPLAVNNDFNGGDGTPEGTDSQLTINLVPGTYFFEITGAEATSGPYEMFVACTNCDE